MHDTTSAKALPLIKRLGVVHPIIQAPMAGVSTPELAAAVSNAGGLGSLGVAAMNVDGARDAIRKTRALTDKPFGVNVFCHAPALPDDAASAKWLQYLAPHFARFGAPPPDRLTAIYTSFVVNPDMVAMLVQERPAVVSFHFGLPQRDVIDALHEAGIFLMATATNLAEAGQIANLGIDAIVAQGIEAGGHRGMFDPLAPDEGLGVSALTRLFVTQQTLPVVAAGGIMDGAGIRAALALGAQAAQLGTAFVSCPESAADAGYRQLLLSGAPVVTTFTTAISGRPARGIANAFTALGEASDCPLTPGYPMTYEAGKALIAAAKAQGVNEFGAYWAGQAAQLSRGLPAAALMQALIAEYQAGAAANIG